MFRTSNFRTYLTDQPRCANDMKAQIRGKISVMPEIKIPSNVSINVAIWLLADAAMRVEI